MAALVRARGVKVYRNGAEVEALSDIDLDIHAGELVAVVGPSGSGKTTLLNCLSGLEDIDAGSIAVEGTELADLSDDERSDWRARRMGFVFQALSRQRHRGQRRSDRRPAGSRRRRSAMRPHGTRSPGGWPWGSRCS